MVKTKLALHYEKFSCPLNLFPKTFLQQEVEQSLFVELDDQQHFSEHLCVHL